MDVSFLITTLPLFLPYEISNWAVCGMSLGGHAALLAHANGNSFFIHEISLSFFLF